MKLFLIVALFTLIFPIDYVNAQGHSAFCSNVDSTAASQECLTRHLKNAQTRLNTVYEKINSSLDQDKKIELQDLQKNWLTYRDAECMWEAGRTEDKILKRVNEMACMARVTENRIDLLTIAQEEGANTNVQREYGDMPRWMNLLAKENPNTYWDYGSRIQGDINCDGQEEHIMVGTTSGLGNSQTKIAIVENPPIGKPKATIIIYSHKDDAALSCLQNIKTNIVEDSSIGTEEGIKEAVCRQSLIINSKNCETKTVNWAGKGFAVKVETKN